MVHVDLSRNAFRPFLCRLLSSLLAAAAVVFPSAVHGQAAPGPLPVSPSARSVEPTALQDDAALFDVTSVGSKLVWAVGDRGVVWKSEDGGRTWSFQPTGGDWSLRSVCFLTDRVGWVVGWTFEPFTGAARGVLLHTTDGGRSWRRLNDRLLPPLVSVRFWGPKIGVVVGTPDGRHGSAVFVTQDGGESWQPLTADATGAWRAAAFVGPGSGVLVGRRGAVALVGGQRVTPSRSHRSSKRNLHAVCLARDLTGWLVGDGGLVLTTVNGGLVWKSPPGSLPEDVAGVFDFHAVAAVGGSVWLAGCPGSAVWHSDDGGRSWQVQWTGQTAPVYALHFASRTTGWAVGAFGTILRTDDAGATWQCVRAGGRRAAVLCVGLGPDNVSLPLLAKSGREQGYRCVAELFCRSDAAGDQPSDADLRFHRAVVETGGCDTAELWQLESRRVPDAERDVETLLQTWLRQTEGRLPDVLLGTLVRDLRVWRPSVVVLDRSDPNNAGLQALVQAVQAAVQQAADPTRQIEHAELAGLSPWRVQRVFVRLPLQDDGPVRIDGYELLPRTGTTVAAVTAPAEAVLTGGRRLSVGRETFRLVEPSTANAPQPRDFWSGLVVSPGSAARRRLPPLDERLLTERQKQAQRQRNLAAYANRYLSNPRLAAQLVAHLPQSTAGLSLSEKAVQLLQLGDRYEQLGHWDLAEQTWTLLLDEQLPAAKAERPSEQFSGRESGGGAPSNRSGSDKSTATAAASTEALTTASSSQPAPHDGTSSSSAAPLSGAAAAAAQRLLRLWVSEELVWQRARHTAAVALQVQPRPDRAAQQALKSLSRLHRDGDVLAAQREIRQASLQPRAVADASTLVRAQPRRHWLVQAERLANRLSKLDPHALGSPQSQLLLASLYRKLGAHRRADQLVYSLLATASSPWTEAAQAEVWLLQRNGLPPKPYALCREAAVRPTLDGQLDDVCWQNAEPVRLEWAWPDGVVLPRRTEAFFSYDRQYLYFAARLPRVPGVAVEPPQYEGRHHDALLTGHDRVSLYLDVDRDYTVFYELHVDQRGFVAESCSGNPAWNPRCYVAVGGDDESWRVELALPLSELTGSRPGPRTVWTVNVVRTVPGHGVQSWTETDGLSVQPARFGLLEFN